MMGERCECGLKLDLARVREEEVLGRGLLVVSIHVSGSGIKGELLSVLHLVCNVSKWLPLGSSFLC